MFPFIDLIIQLDHNILQRDAMSSQEQCQCCPLCLYYSTTSEHLTVVRLSSDKFTSHGMLMLLFLIYLYLFIISLLLSICFYLSFSIGQSSPIFFFIYPFLLLLF